ncbi:MAG: type II/IV secretion system protein, partial [Burkholderiaceae bacterium]
MKTKDGAVQLKVVAPTRDRPEIAVPNGRVTGGYVLKQLVADGLLAVTDAERFKTTGGRERAGHPLAALAEMNFRTPNTDHKLLDLEMLTQWLAERAGLPYQHIDPLRVDFTRVVDVMSSSYATTYSILPIATTATEVTIATSEPFQTGWEREIEQITKKAVKRVVANPLDVARYTTEFY